MNRNTIRRARRGFALPVALIAVTLATTVASAVLASSWRAARAARLAFAGERALHAAELALVTTASIYTPQYMTHMAVGAREVHTNTPTFGITTAVTATRTTTTLVRLDARATVTSGTHFTAQRELTRYLSLDASAIELPATLSALGALHAAAGARVDGFGSATHRETTCGSTQDTSAHAALAAVTLALDNTDTPLGAPPQRLLSADSANAIAQRILARVNALGTPTEMLASPASFAPTATGATCTSASGEPRRNAFAVTPCVQRWPLRRIGNASGTIQVGNARHQGTLVVDGNLLVTGILEVRGLLIVGGTIDSRLGALDVTGAVVSLHHNGGTTTLGSADSLRFSRCAVRRAVTPLAMFATPPVAAWAQRY